MFNTSEFDELFRILISIKGFKLKQPQWSNTTISQKGAGPSVISPVVQCIAQAESHLKESQGQHGGQKRKRKRSIKRSSSKVKCRRVKDEDIIYSINTKTM